MPELPEIFNLAGQLKSELAAKSITGIEIKQEKCLNIPIEDFCQSVIGKKINDITYKGKWIIFEFADSGNIFLSLGMGGDMAIICSSVTYEKKYQFRLNFDDNRSLYISFWWFGYFHYAQKSDEHKMTAMLGLNPLGIDFEYEAFEKMLQNKKGNIKSFLMDQHNVAGIGNVYIQDILFLAKLHPLRKIINISAEERQKLFETIKEQLKYAALKGGFRYEKDLYGNLGTYECEYVGYKKGQNCKICGAIIEEIKTGSTHSCICPNCQT